MKSTQPKARKPEYRIFWDGYDWVATTTEFRNASGCASTPKQALRELFMATAGMREIIKEDKSK